MRTRFTRFVRSEDRGEIQGKTSADLRIERGQRMVEKNTLSKLPLSTEIRSIFVIE